MHYGWSGCFNKGLMWILCFWAMSSHAQHDLFAYYLAQAVHINGKIRQTLLQEVQLQSRK